MPRMDQGIWAILFGLAAFWMLRKAHYGWLRAAGGLLIIVTLVLIALQLSALAFGAQ